MRAEHRAEAVHEGDGTEPRAGGGVNRHACRSDQQPHDLSKKDLREGADGLGAVGEEAAQTGERRKPPVEDGLGRRERSRPG